MFRFKMFGSCSNNVQCQKMSNSANFNYKSSYNKSSISKKTAYWIAVHSQQSTHLDAHWQVFEWWLLNETAFLSLQCTYAEVIETICLVITVHVTREESSHGWPGPTSRGFNHCYHPPPASISFLPGTHRRRSHIACVLFIFGPYLFFFYWLRWH